MAHARSWVVAASLALPMAPLAGAQETRLTVVPGPIEHTPNACAKASFENDRRLAMFVPGHDAAVPFGGFSMHAHDYSCRRVAFYRVFEAARTETGPAPIFSDQRPPCPDGWERPRRASVACMRVVRDATPVFVARFVSEENPDQWADGRKCPTVEAAVKRMEALAAPKLTGDADDRYGVLVLDGAGFDLWIQGYAYPAREGLYRQALRMSSNYHTPLAAFVEETFAALKPCLSAEPPKP